MKKLLLFVSTMALLPHLSFAQLIWFQAELNGLQENPPVFTSATGFATASLDLGTNFFVFHDSWTNLSAPSTASHIHGPAPIGTNAPVLLPFTSANGFVAGTTSGMVDYSSTLTAGQVSQLLAGLWYVNVHTTAFPAGEIRGQLVAVPEVSTYAFGGGLVLLLLMGRRLIVAKKARAT